MKIKNGKYYIGKKLSFDINVKIIEKYYLFNKRSAKEEFIQNNIIELDKLFQIRAKIRFFTLWKNKILLRRWDRRNQRRMY